MLVAAFWTKVGTPTGEHPSGTIEEIEEYLKDGQHAMLYFSDAPVMPDSIDPAQYAELKKFKDSCKSKGLYASYSDLNDFAKKFYHHLEITLNGSDFVRGVAEVSEEISPNPIVALSADAQTLLKNAASGDGSIMYLRHLNGAVIGTTGDNLVIGNDARSLARWEAALNELVRNDLVSGNSAGSNFRVSAEGYSIADGIA